MQFYHMRLISVNVRGANSTASASTSAFIAAATHIVAIQVRRICPCINFMDGQCHSVAHRGGGFRVLWWIESVERGNSGFAQSDDDGDGKENEQNVRQHILDEVISCYGIGDDVSAVAHRPTIVTHNGWGRISEVGRIGRASDDLG